MSNRSKQRSAIHSRGYPIAMAMGAVIVAGAVTVALEADAKQPAAREATQTHALLPASTSLPAQPQAAQSQATKSHAAQPPATLNVAPSTSAPAATAPSPTDTDKAAAEAAAQAAARRKAEIDTAKARCTALLAKLDVVAIPRDAIEEGECGTLAPVELISVGKSPAVALSPAVIVNCDMAAAVHDWIKVDVQPLAKKHLGLPVSRMETMSSYSCRNAFGRKNGKLSEHGKANAIDIRGFVTTKGDTAHVLENWGLTGEEIKLIAAKAEEARRLADAKAKADADAKARALAAAGKGGSGPDAPSSPSNNPLAAAGTLIEGLPKPNITINGGGLGGGGRPSDFGIAPSRLGGPKPAVQQAEYKPGDKLAAGPRAGAAAPTVTVPAPSGSAPAGNATTGNERPDPKSEFLRAVHLTACKRFMTTLGPEADKAHRNHFHIDLAERRTPKPICD